jgi:hypothetical protein
MAELSMGIICNGKSLEDWQVRCINYLLDLPFVKLKLLIIPVSDALSQHTKLSHYLYTLYRRYWFHHPPRKHEDMHLLFSTIPTIHPIVIRDSKFSIIWGTESVEQIQAYHLDFILNFQRHIIHGVALTTAHYGIWSFHHGDETKYRGSPSGFWEIYNNDPRSGAVLQRMTEKLDNGIILRRGSFKTINYSYLKNLENIFYASAKWPQEVCEDIQAGKADYFDKKPIESTGKIYHPPGNLQMINFFMKLFGNKLSYFLSKAHR